MKVSVIGTGYVGLVTGVVLAELGNDVVCVEKDPRKLEMLRAGRPPIYEPGLEEMLQRGLKSEHLRVSDSIAEATRHAEVIFIAVGTPAGTDGSPDLSAVRTVAAEIGKAIDHPTLVVNKSTVPVGSGDMVEEIILAQGADSALFDVLSNPEFLREGSAIQDTLHPDRIVVGAKRRTAAEKLLELYEPLAAPSIVTDLNSAELIKYGANSFLAMKISFINAMSRLCEQSGANVADVARGIGADGRIGPQFLGAGLGWGGSCFPKDVQGLIKVSEGLGYDFRLLREVYDINEDQTLHFLDRIRRRLGGFEGKRVGLMGIAFKPNTDDIRDAKSLVIVEHVLREGGQVAAYDPVAGPNLRTIHPEVELVDHVYGVSNGVDALVVVTDWNEFRRLDLSRLAEGMAKPLLFDGRLIYSRTQAERAGFEYHVIGSRS